MVGALTVGLGDSAIANVGTLTIDATAGFLTAASTGVSYVADTKVRVIHPPTGGVMQFKGLVNGTTIE